MEIRLTSELAKAWAEKAERLAEQLGHMERGFALFRPEDVKRTRDDFARAIHFARFWAAQS